MPNEWHYHPAPPHTPGSESVCAYSTQKVISCVPDPASGQYLCTHGTPTTGGGGGTGGTPKKKCFLATACVEFAGLPDDCVELQVMRDFRDNYVATLPEGPGIISTYYEVAPAIIDRINTDGAKELIYAYMLSRLRTVVEMIQSGRHAEAHALYISEYKKLRERYGM